MGNIAWFFYLFVGTNSRVEQILLQFIPLWEGGNQPVVVSGGVIMLGLWIRLLVRNLESKSANYWAMHSPFGGIQPVVGRANKAWFFHLFVGTNSEVEISKLRCTAFPAGEGAEAAGNLGWR